MRKICAQIEMQLVDAVSECARMEQQRQMHSECIKRMLVNVAIAECTEYALKSCQNASEWTFYIIASECAACHMQKNAIHNGMHRNASKILLNAAGENDTAYGRKRHLSPLAPTSSRAVRAMYRHAACRVARSVSAITPLGTWWCRAPPAVSKS